MRPRTFIAAALVVAAGIGAYVTRSTPPEPYTLDAPVEFFAPQWEEALGGDQATPGGELPVQAVASRTDLDPESQATAVRLASDLALAAATGDGTEWFAGYFARNHAVINRPNTPPSGAAARYCTSVQVLAASPFTVPTAPAGGYVKALVLWTGTCPFPPPSVGTYRAAPVFVNFVYLARTSVYPRPVAEPFAAAYGGWVPIRPAEFPGAERWLFPAAPPPATWEVTALRGCAVGTVLARLEVAAAWDALCTDASGAGLALQAVDGLRDADAQQERFDAAVRIYGSERAARARVAYSDGTRCDSLHCAGEAVDVADIPGVLAWLRAPVGCIEGGTYRESGCTDTATVVLRLERYGFVAPNPSYPTHLEFSLGTRSTDADLYGDCTPGAIPSAQRIDLMFRCRVIEAGLGFELPTTAAKDAVVVATCTSGLQAGFRSFDGRFAQAANPATGATDDREGVFGLSAAVAERWMAPGADRKNASANIDAAARIYVEERLWGRWGWDLFACAAFDDGTTVR